VRIRLATRVCSAALWVALGLAFLAHADSSNRKTYWVQQKNLKVLSDQASGHDAVERYLNEFDSTLVSFFHAHPDLGSLVHHDRRDTVIVSNLSDSDFRDLVINPLLDQVTSKLDQIRFPRQRSHWREWMAKNTVHGSGDSIEQAFLDLRTREFGITYDEWRITATNLRKHLIGETLARGVEWDEVLRASRKYGRAPAEMLRWVRSKGMEKDIADRIIEFGRLLTMSDYLPPGAAVNHAMGWETHPPNSPYILVTDVQELGVLNRREQDRWLARGARIQELSNVHATGTAKIAAVNGRTEALLGEILGSGTPFPRLITAGDETVWALPSLTPEQLRTLQLRLSAARDLHFHLSQTALPRSQAAFEQRLGIAREAMKSIPHQSSCDLRVGGILQQLLPSSPGR